MAQYRTLLSFHQNPTRASAVIAELRKQRFTRSALIHRSQDGIVNVNNGGLAPRDGALAGGAIFALGAILATALFSLPFSALVVSLTALILGAIGGALWAHAFVPGVSRKQLVKYKRRLIKGETLVMVQASARHVEQVLALLDKTTDTSAITFVIHQQSEFEISPPLRSELLPAERLHARAARLAAETRTAKAGREKKLLHRLRENTRILKNIHHDLS
ncbi:MAG: hypothetical protein ACREV2_13720, partial [Burkholderiales bacterium]